MSKEKLKETLEKMGYPAETSSAGWENFIIGKGSFKFYKLGFKPNNDLSFSIWEEDDEGSEKLILAWYIKPKNIDFDSMIEAIQSDNKRFNLIFTIDKDFKHALKCIGDKPMHDTDFHSQYLKALKRKVVIYKKQINNSYSDLVKTLIT